MTIDATTYCQPLSSTVSNRLPEPFAEMSPPGRIDLAKVDLNPTHPILLFPYADKTLQYAVRWFYVEQQSAVLLIEPEHGGYDPDDGPLPQAMVRFFGDQIEILSEQEFTQLLPTINESIRERSTLPGREWNVRFQRDAKTVGERLCK